MTTVYKETDQRTEEWLKLKWGKVGGTLSAGLFVDSDTLMLEILGQQSEDFQIEEHFVNAAMQRGQDLEPLALRELSAYTGVDFKNVAWIQNNEIPLIGISPDGLSDDETIACEVKCFEAKNHLSIILNDDIPKKNIHQCLHYFTVNPKLEKLYFMAFRPESNLRKIYVKELRRDSLIDIGQTYKGKVNEDRGHGLKDYVAVLPDIKTVDEWAKIAQDKAIEIQSQIDVIKDRLTF